MAVRIVHIVAGLGERNGMANTARQFAAAENAAGCQSVVADAASAVRRGVDRVHIHGAWLPVLWRSARRAKAVGAELVVRPAGSYSPIYLAYHGWKKRLVSPFEHAMLRRADVIQASCPVEAEWIAAYAGDSSRIQCFDLSRFFSLDREVAPAKNVRHLLYLGRRHPLKGIDVLEAALREIGEVRASPTLTGGELLRVGLDGGRGMLEIRIESSVFGDDKEAALDWCDALVLPTMSENFGRVVAEALEHGKPALTTDGAPAWEGRRGVVYVKGFRGAPFAERVRLLRGAIESMV